MIKTALKEWDLVISAMLAGRQAVLLRKGGILEADNQFELEHPRFLFFPTFVHQDPRMVKPEFRAGIKTLREEPEKIEIRAWGEAAKIVEVPSRAALEKLDDLHVWAPPLLDMRFSYRPEKPLYLVVVRAYRLKVPVVIENTIEYAGCKSWVPLEQPIDVSSSDPAMAAEALDNLLERVERTFAR